MKQLIIILLFAFAPALVISKIYTKCEFAEELYFQHKILPEEIGYHLCVARMYSKFNTQYNDGYFLSIYRIGTQWWCGKDGNPGGICNIRCSSLIDDYLADDIKCVKEVTRIHGFNTWGATREACEQDFKDMAQCLRNKIAPTLNCVSTRSTETCGKPYQVRGAVIGGSSLSQSQRGSYPWTVALIYTTNDYFCGGVLISKNKVLTAAHCMLPKGSSQQLLPKDIRALLGVFDLNDRFEVGRSIMAIERIRMHADWNPNTQRYDGDIAVLYMDSDVLYNRYIQPICLSPPHSNLFSITEGVVVGYGIGSTDTKKNENIPKIINLPIHQNEDCYLHNPTFAGISSKNTFCAGSGRGAGVCLGDSGSGLYVKNCDTYFLRGIVSASLFTPEENCNVNDYAIFTNANSYYSWITRD